jgi:hypothetical protein
MKERRSTQSGAAWMIRLNTIATQTFFQASAAMV